ncbi:hypothetical protein ATANTOWER_018039 [Ataeniobius toweri]|uniref:Uncharacterized protein n=1 Tax=Ataeniobius toweri TaxID=208326 RepID=A0ABU7CI55_9TELE|nr:hypothetical protein [Ataeniobius toweri]
MPLVMRLTDKSVCVCLNPTHHPPPSIGFPGDQGSREERSSYMLPHHGRIKLSKILSTAFHHLESNCLIS